MLSAFMLILTPFMNAGKTYSSILCILWRHCWGIFGKYCGQCVLSLPHSTGLHWKAGEGPPWDSQICFSFHPEADCPRRCRRAHTGCSYSQGFVSLLPVETLSGKTTAAIRILFNPSITTGKEPVYSLYQECTMCIYLNTQLQSCFY